MKTIIKLIAFLFIVIVVILIAGTAIDLFRMEKLKKQATSIHPGDSLESVISILGVPNLTRTKNGENFSFFMTHKKELVYGLYFDWKNAFLKKSPFFFPFNLRLFNPSNDDLVIGFDDQEKVEDIFYFKTNQIESN